MTTSNGPSSSARSPRNRPRSSRRNSSARSPAGARTALRTPRGRPLDADSTCARIFCNLVLLAQRNTASVASAGVFSADYPSGQRGLTVNQLALPTGVRIPHLPPSETPVHGPGFRCVWGGSRRRPRRRRVRFRRSGAVPPVGRGCAGQVRFRRLQPPPLQPSGSFAPDPRPRPRQNDSEPSGSNRVARA